MWKKINNSNLREINLFATNSEKYAKAAMGLGAKIEYENIFNTLSITYKNKTEFIIDVTTSLNSQAAYRLVGNKYLTHSIWKKKGINCPDFEIIKKSEYKKRGFVFPKVNYPTVIKPARDSMHGEMVVTNINSRKQLEIYIKNIFSKYSEALIESYHANLNEYRILILKKKIIGISRKIPANIIGDGQKNIKELIKEKNILRSEYSEYHYAPIKVDEELKKTLNEQKLKLTSVPKKGKFVQLKNVANLSAGGETVIERKIHPSVKKLALKATEVLDIDFCGLDLLAKDITKPLKKGRDVFIEANASPGLNLHFDFQKKKIIGISR
ncbi:hypothetical protein KKF29_02775, partial [Patescibacteria group bacterium]|nr:hypothetical protein [Patescibacteria group bacterium]